VHFVHFVQEVNFSGSPDTHDSESRHPLSYIGFSVADVLVPFASSYRALWLSLGIIAGELLLAVGASVWVRDWIGYRAWHILHGLAYPILLMSLLHALGAGADTRTPWALGLYGGSVVLLAVAVAWRLTPARHASRPVPLPMPCERGLVGEAPRLHQTFIQPYPNLQFATLVLVPAERRSTRPQ
jgi:hypothetical protein